MEVMQMKILDSGIEIDPKDLSKIRGSACSCGCGIGYDSMDSSALGVDAEFCQCDCASEFPNPEEFQMGISASRYLQRP